MPFLHILRAASLSLQTPPPALPRRSGTWRVVRAPDSSGKDLGAEALQAECQCPVPGGRGLSRQHPQERAVQVPLGHRWRGAPALGPLSPSDSFQNFND